MWPYDDESQTDAVTSDFSGVAESIFEQAETEENGLLALQDAYNSYDFHGSTDALTVFQEQSNAVRKKFGDTKPFDFNTTLELAPNNFDEFTSDLPDPGENSVDIVNKWEESNLKSLSEVTDLNQIQLRPQLERSIKQLATVKRREIYGSDNYLVTDQALRMTQGLVGPIASLVGADSVNDFFTENTDPDGASVFGYTIGGDESYWSAISSGLGSVAGAMGSGLVSGGWGTLPYLAASGAGAVRARVEDALENEASTGEAVAAGMIEGASQVGQTIVGTKVFGGAVNKILGKSTNALGERIFPKLIKSGALEGGTEGIGQVVSNVGENVGRGEDLDSDLLKGVPQSLVAGFVGGGVAEVAGELGSIKLREGKPDIEIKDPETGQVYEAWHGSPNEFTEFDPDKKGTNTINKDSKEGFFFSSDKEVADTYTTADTIRAFTPEEETRYKKLNQEWDEANAESKQTSDLDIKEAAKARMKSIEKEQEFLQATTIIKEGTKSKKVKVKMHNPYIVEDFATEDSFNIYGNLGSPGTYDSSRVLNIINTAKNNGHDGVVIKNIKDSSYVGSKAATTYIAFNPSQATFDPLLETEGTTPAKAEAIPGKLVSASLQNPGIPRATLSDGSSIVEADGKFHLQNGDKTLQAYETVKYVSPETAQQLRQLMTDGNPDGTAVTLTTDGESLLVESEFIKDDLSSTGQKTGKLRIPIKQAETEQGSVPVFVSKTRTADGVRQNPFFIAPGKVESTAGAATAGFGNQYVSPYMERMIAKYGSDLAEELGLTAKGDVENVDGTLEEISTPLQTKFKTTHAATGADAAQFIDQNGLLGTIDYLTKNNKFNETDAAVSNILVNKLDSFYRAAHSDFTATQSPESLNKLANIGDLLNQAMLLKDKVSTTSGRMLGSLTNTADQIHNSKYYGEFRVAQIEAELTKAAYDQYQKDTGEPVNIQQWTKEAQAAEAVMKANTPKEGESLSPDAQAQVTKAREVYDKSVEKIKEANRIKTDKLKDLTPESKTNLIDMYELLGSLDGEMKLQFAEKVFDREVSLGIKDVNPDKFEQLYNFFRGNLLSGPTTQLRNLVGNTTKVMSDIIGLIGTGEFRQAGLFLDQWLRTSKDSGQEFIEIVQGNRAGRFKFDAKAVDSKGNTKQLKKAAPLTNPFTAVQNAMYRLLTAQDSVFFRNNHSAMAYLVEDVASKKLPPGERQAYIEKALGFDQEGNIRTQVEKEAQLLRNAGIEVNQRQVDLDTAYRMEKLRSEKTREIAEKYGERSVFTNDPAGLMGAFYETLEKLSEKVAIPVGNTHVKPLKFLMPFTRVAANVTSHIMEFTPVGTVKALANNADSRGNVFNHQLSSIEAKMVLGRSIIGSTFMAGFLAFADAFNDDDDPYIAFYGYPPKGKWKEWQAKNIEPFSMKIGNNIIPLQGTSLAIIPAVIGGAMESKKAGASMTDVVMAASVASLGAVSTMSFLKPAGELFDYLAASKDSINLEAGQSASGTTEKRRSNFLKGQVDTVGSGFIPASGMLNNIGRWMNESPVETYNNLTAKLLGEMPFSKSLGLTDKDPQLNMFGEAITMSLAQRFAKGLAPHTIKTDPIFLWMQETGFNIPDQGPIVGLTRKVEKENFGEIQKNITGFANIMNEAQSRRVLQLSGPRIKEFLNSIKQDPNFQVKGKEAQEYINETVNNIRAEAKLQVLSN